MPLFKKIFIVDFAEWTGKHRFDASTVFVRLATTQLANLFSRSETRVLTVFGPHYMVILLEYLANLFTIYYTCRYRGLLFLIFRMTAIMSAFEDFLISPIH